MSDRQETSSFDAILDALSQIQRRTLLVALLEPTPPTVAPGVAGETERTTFKQSAAMNHVHLPKLANYGFIEWDRENDEVSKGASFDEIRPLLELLDNHRDELLSDSL
jgi:hypothetical protein